MKVKFHYISIEIEIMTQKVPVKVNFCYIPTKIEIMAQNFNTSSFLQKIKKKIIFYPLSLVLRPLKP